MTLLDQTERESALDPTQSFIIQAPAGSGKTELLIQRLLTLLTRVNKPEEILAITFTKKAANEMRARLLNVLKQGTHPLAVAVLKRDQQLQWHLLQNPNQLCIQTIDSFCVYLTKHLPLLAHFGSAPDIALQPTELYRETITEVLAHVEEKVEWAPAISLLLIHLDNHLNKLHDLLVELLAKRDQWLPYIHLDLNATEIKKQLEAHLQAVIQDTLQAVIRLFPAEILTHIQSQYGDLLARETWITVANILLTKTFTWRKKLPHSIFELIIENEAIRSALISVTYLPPATFDNTQWEILRALLQVLKISVAQLRVTFQQTGQIDFIENAQAAIQALGDADNPTDLALALDYQIQHLLIDEFQDTSITQYQLLEKLIAGWEPEDGRTLFVVGDPMQSIYRFREAEVGLFIRMRHEGIGHLHLIPLTLQVNFRSTATVVNWNNQHFQDIFPSFNDIATGAVTYSPSVAFHESNETSQVRLHSNIDAETSQPEQLVALVKTTLQQHPQESLAILVRSRTHLTEIIALLKKANIAYNAIDIDPLASRQSITDLLALTSALLHPADRIAWLAILRAPWCGLTLADLHGIAQQSQWTIWEQLLSTKVAASLTTDGQARVVRLLAVIKPAMQERGRYPLRYWIEKTWLSLGGPASLQGDEDKEDVEAYFRLLETLPTAPFDYLKEKTAALYAKTQQSQSPLSIMTIHAAKGLEFDTVIIPHLEKKMPSDDKHLLAWMERPLQSAQTALLLAPIQGVGEKKDLLYEYIRKQQRIKSDYEIDRLLYVATTRAKKRLHLFFNLTRKQNSSEGHQYRMDAGTFLSRLWGSIGKVDSTGILDKNDTQDNPIISANTPVMTKRMLIRFAKDWKHPCLQTESGSRSLFNAATALAGFKLQDTTAQLIGTVYHLAMQYMAQQGLAWWEKQTVDEQRQWLKRQLLQRGLTQPQGAVETLEGYLNNTLQDPQGRWLLAAHSEAQSELALTVMLNNEAKHIVIDRTFIAEGVRWIIDYKTTTHQEDLAAQREQLALYATAMSHYDHHPIRTALYFPAIPCLREEG